MKIDLHYLLKFIDRLHERFSTCFVAAQQPALIAAESPIVNRGSRPSSSNLTEW